MLAKELYIRLAGVLLLLCAVSICSAQSQWGRSYDKPKDKDEEPDTRVHTTEIPYSTTMPMKDLSVGDNKCQASVLLNYAQYNDRVKVESEIENTDCAASHGQFTMVVKSFDDNGEQYTDKYVEKWQREDSQSAINKHEYPLRENTQIKRVYTRTGFNDFCTCLAAESEDLD